MACKLVDIGTTDDVSFTIHKEVERSTVNNTVISEAESGEIEAVEYGYAAEIIVVRFIALTASKLAELKTFLYDWKTAVIKYYEIDGVSSVENVRWIDAEFKRARKFHDGYYGTISFRTEKA